MSTIRALLSPLLLSSFFAFLPLSYHQTGVNFGYFAASPHFTPQKYYSQLDYFVKNERNPIIKTAIVKEEEPEESLIGRDEEDYNYDNATAVPLEIIKRMNDYENVEEILQNLVEDYRNKSPSITSRFGDSEDYDEEERSNAIKPKPAKCQPKLTTVKLVESNDPSILYIPACTRIEQCDGCCSHYLTSCRPIETEIVNFVVHKCKYTGGNKLKFLEKEIVVKEKHLKCQCGCKVQSTDCKGFREYNPSTCSCSCPNKDERQKCLKDYERKLWNPKLCSCQCRNVLPCSTDQYFDYNKCKCIVNLRRVLQRDETSLVPFA